MSREHMNRPDPYDLRMLADATEARDRAEKRYSLILEDPARYTKSVGFDFYMGGCGTRGIGNGDLEPLIPAMQKIIGEQIVTLAREALRGFVTAEQEARARVGLAALKVPPEFLQPGQGPDTLVEGPSAVEGLMP